MKCIKCGSDLKKDSVFCSNCGINQNDIKKSNNIWLVFLFLLGIIVIISLSVLGYIMFLKNEAEKIDEKIVYDDSYVSFDRYHIKVPDNFKYFTYLDKRYLKNDYCTMEFSKYPVTITQINNNKDYLFDTLRNNNYKIIDYVGSDDEMKFIKIKVDLNDIQYGLLFYTKEDLTILFKIVSNNLSDFEDNWFDYVKEIINNMV